jgi:hypothetical protein
MRPFHYVNILSAAATWIVLSHASPAIAQAWSFRGVVAAGEQLDAVAGPAGKVHLVSSGYHEIDKQENVLVSESQGETAQNHLWAFLFPPAIAVGPDGTVHVVVRDGGGYDGWLNLRYKRRDPSGVWTSGYAYSTPTKWNWNVGVADDGKGHVHLLASNHGGGGSVWADLQLFQHGGAAASLEGTLTNVYRVDYEARMRARDGKVYLATSNAFTSSSAYFSHGPGGPGVGGALKNNMQALQSGTGSEKGFPDLAIDGLGNVHYTYGSGHTNHDSFPGSTAGCVPGEVHYAKFDASGNRVLPSDRTVFTGLGVWHLSVGLSAVGASDDGNTVVAVALRSPDDKEAGNSDILWSVSTDGGASWSAPQDLGVNTHAGEGRRRPRLVALGSKFFLFYRDQSIPGISLATLAFPEAAPVAPATPLNLTATAQSESQIEVCWLDNVADEDGFVVERRGGEQFTEIASSGANTICHTDTGLAPGTAYTYRVRAFTGGMFSDYSNEAAASTHGASGAPMDAGTEEDANSAAETGPQGPWPEFDGGQEPTSEGQGNAFYLHPTDEADGCACATRRPVFATVPALSVGLALLLLCRRRRPSSFL